MVWSNFYVKGAVSLFYAPCYLRSNLKTWWFKWFISADETQLPFSKKMCITLQRNSKQIRLGQSTFLSLQENLEREKENFLCPSTKTGQFVAHELKTWSHRKKKGFCPQGKNPCSLISAHISGTHLRNTLPMLERVLLAAARIRMRFKLGRPVEKQVIHS